MNPELNRKSFEPVAADGAVVQVLGSRGRTDVAGGRQPERGQRGQPETERGQRGRLETERGQWSEKSV